MTEPLPETRPPDTTYPAIEPDAALARKNMLWGFSLLAVFLVLFGGSFLVAFVYLWLS